MGAKPSGSSPVGEEPSWSDLPAFNQGERVFDVHARVAHGVLDFGVTEQDLDRPQPLASIDMKDDRRAVMRAEQLAPLGDQHHAQRKRAEHQKSWKHLLVLGALLYGSVTWSWFLRKRRWVRKLCDRESHGSNGSPGHSRL